jgi:hypothetical protein
VSIPSEEQFQAACATLIADDKPVDMSLPLSVFLCLVTQVQLALRHSANKGPSADCARQWAEAAVACFEAKYPVIAEVLRAGFDPANDTEWTVYK